MLDIDKGSKVTRPDFPKKSRVGRKSVKTGENWGLKKRKKNGSNDFDKKLHEDRGDRYGAAKKNRTSKFSPGRRKITKNRWKYRFFGFFSETTIEISSIFRQSVEDDSADQSQKALENLLF